MKKYKNYIITILIYLVMILLAIGAGAIASHIEKNNVHVYELYNVKSGDTVWTIAEQYTSDKYDVRKTVRDINRKNELENSVVHSGDVIYVPITYRGN